MSLFMKGVMTIGDSYENLILVERSIITKLKLNQDLFSYCWNKLVLHTLPIYFPKLYTICTQAKIRNLRDF